MWKGFQRRPDCLLAALGAHILLCFSLICVLPAAAQPPSRELDRLLQQQLQAQQARARDLQQPSRRGRDLQPEALQVAPPAGDCVAVHRIQLDAGNLLSAAAVDRLRRIPERGCLSAAAIRQRLQQINQRLQQRGFITSRAVAPPQDLVDGTLLIRIITGHIESITADSEVPSDSLLDQMFPGGQGAPLNLRDIEQGLDNLNRLRSLTATVDLLPGAEPGGSIVAVRAESDARWFYRLSVDNHGQSRTGKYQSGALLALDNPVNRGGFLYLYLQTDVASQADSASARSWQLHYDMPFGYYQFDLDVSSFRYRAEIPGLSAAIVGDGSVRQYRLGLQRVLYRDGDGILKAALDWRQRDSVNRIAGVSLAGSTRDLEVAGMSLDYQRFFESATVALGAGVARGVGWTATDYDSEAPDGPQSRFRKLWLELRAQGRPNPDWIGPARWRQRLYWQRSSQRLFASEQVSIGGHHSVRGFTESSFSGSRGGYWRQSLSLFPAGNASPLRPSEFELGLDVGRVRDDVFGWQTLRSAWLEWQRSWRQISLTINYSRAFAVPAVFADDGEALLLSLQFASG